jgi:hypothetical protein
MHNGKRLFDIVTVLGLLIGLGLVIAQLHQNEQLIRFQIATEFRFNQDANRAAIKGEDFSKALAKLQTDPESLRVDELLQFQAHARSLVSELDMRRVLATVGIFESDWRAWLQPETCDLMDNSVGRAWVEAKRAEQVWLETQGTVPSREPDDEILDELERRLEECSERPSFLKSVRYEQIQ